VGILDKLIRAHVGFVEKGIVSESHIHKSAEIHDVPNRPLKFIPNLEVREGAHGGPDHSSLRWPTHILPRVQEPLDNIPESVLANPKVLRDKRHVRQLRNTPQSALLVMKE
jgi:hypothetical protein